MTQRACGAPSSIISLYVGKNGLGTVGTRSLAWGLAQARERDSCWRRSGTAWRRVKLLQKVLGILVAIVIIVWIVSDPAGAGNSVHNWISGIVTFFHHLI